MFAHVEDDGICVTFGKTDVFVDWDELGRKDINLQSAFAKAVEIAECKLPYKVFIDEMEEEGMMEHCDGWL